MANTEQTVVKERAYTLTSEEKNVLGNQLLGLLNDEDELAREKKAAIADYKAQEEALGNRIVELRKKASTGIEMRKYKCYRLRNVQDLTIDFVVAEGEKKGEVLETQPWSTDDWDAHLKETQIDMFDGVTNPDAPNKDDIRHQASLTNEPALTPDMDEMGNVVAGPDTDAYNMAHKDSPYQHLSEVIDFKPAIVPPAVEQPQDEAAKPTDAANVDRDDEHDMGTPHLDGTPSWGDDEPGNDSEGDEQNDDESQPDEPAPNPAKRKARRKDDPKK